VYPRYGIKDVKLSNAVFILVNRGISYYSGDCRCGCLGLVSSLFLALSDGYKCVEAEISYFIYGGGHG
jgi:hypothetical protein